MTDTAMADHQIKYMAERFLGWKLPKSWHPDGGISFEPEFNAEYNAKHGLPPQRREPTGTNLFDYTQAVAMIYHMVEGLPEFFLEWDGPLTTEEEAKIDEAWETHKAAAVIARHIPQSGDGLEIKRLKALAADHFRNATRLAGVVVERDAQIAQLETRCERMAGALGVIAPLLDYLPHPHCITAIEAARQALEKDASALNPAEILETK